MMSFCKYTGYLITSLVIITAGCSPSPDSADQIITNAVVWTGNPAQPRAEAIAILGDRNLLEIDPVQIREAQILRTIVGGRTVYTRTEHL